MNARIQLSKLIYITTRYGIFVVPILYRSNYLPIDDWDSKYNHTIEFQIMDISFKTNNQMRQYERMLMQKIVRHLKCKILKFPIKLLQKTTTKSLDPHMRIPK